MMTFIPHRPGATLDNMGFIPDQVSEHDPRSAAEQFKANAPDGWHPRVKFTLTKDLALLYPGDLPLYPICELVVRQERIVLYPCDWVAIFQPDGSYEVARLT